MSTASFTLPSFAKINWSLSVLGKRPDGYHEIRTILQTTSLHDSLSFAAVSESEIVFTCDDSRVPAGESNVVVRAANALRERFSIQSGAAINLEKRIPIKGGLGGGSSNAAVTLLGLAQLWRVSAGASELAQIAEVLGADVPFFLYGGRALATGTGTTLMCLPDTATQHLLIVSPDAKVSTAKAYAALRLSALTTTESNPILAVSRGVAKSTDSDQWSPFEDLGNDFEGVIFDIEPEIARAKKALIRAGARGALLAGSGSSVFGIFDSHEARRRALNDIETESGWRVFSCDTLSRAEYFRALGSSGNTLRQSLNPESDPGA